MLNVWSGLIRVDSARIAGFNFYLESLKDIYHNSSKKIHQNTDQVIFGPGWNSVWFEWQDLVSKNIFQKSDSLLYYAQPHIVKHFAEKRYQDYQI